MKMKKACEATYLTERAIRLYLKKNLISPRQTDGIIDFSNEDIQQLKDIALLRQFDFSIEQISCMIHDPATIRNIVLLRTDNARADIEHEKEVHAILSGLAHNGLNSVHSIASQIREHRVVPPEPDFGRFDEISDEVREQESVAAFKDLSRIEKKEKRRNRMIAIACGLTALVVLAICFLSYPRISGFISIAPLSVLEINGDDTAKVFINSEWAVDVIGRNTITVPYRIYGKHLEVGDAVEHGCQLAIELTNFDLAQIGVNPLQDFQTGSAVINDEWMKFIVRSLFDNAPGENATLWIHEISNLKPLLWQE